MTGPLAEFFDEGRALAAAPDPWDITDHYLGPTVEVRKYRPFSGNNLRRNDAVWAVVDREAARERLVTPAPLTDPALLDRDDDTNG